MLVRRGRLGGAWRGGRLGALDASESSLTRVDIADCKIDTLDGTGPKVTASTGVTGLA